MQKLTILGEIMQSFIKWGMVLIVMSFLLLIALVIFGMKLMAEGAVS
jgi:hypothetical protein